MIDRLSADVVYEGVDMTLLWAAISSCVAHSQASQFVLGHQRKCDEGSFTRCAQKALVIVLCR